MADSIHDIDSLEEGWSHTLEVVDLPKTKPVYQPSHADSLPEVLASQVIASRDPRLSPDLPAQSIYSRDFVLDDDWREGDGDDEDSASFHSEDWYCQDVGKSFEEEAKNLKVRIHINPKFFPNIGNTSGSQSQDLPSQSSPDETKTGRKDLPSPIITPTKEPEEESIKIARRRPAPLTSDKLPAWMKEEFTHKPVPRPKDPDRKSQPDTATPKDTKTVPKEQPESHISKTHSESGDSKTSHKETRSDKEQDSNKPYSEKVQAWMEATEEFLNDKRKPHSKPNKEDKQLPKAYKDDVSPAKGSKDDISASKSSREGYCTSSSAKRNRSRSGSRRRYPALDASAHKPSAHKATRKNQAVPEEEQTNSVMDDDSETDEPGIQTKLIVVEKTSPSKSSKQTATDDKEEDIILDPRVPDMYRAEMEEKIQEERRKKREQKHKELSKRDIPVNKGDSAEMTSQAKEVPSQEIGQEKKKEVHDIIEDTNDPAIQRPSGKHSKRKAVSDARPKTVLSDQTIERQKDAKPFRRPSTEVPAERRERGADGHKSPDSHDSKATQKKTHAQTKQATHFKDVPTVSAFPVPPAEKVAAEKVAEERRTVKITPVQSQEMECDSERKKITEPEKEILKTSDPVPVTSIRNFYYEKNVENSNQDVDSRLNSQKSRDNVLPLPKRDDDVQREKKQTALREDAREMDCVPKSDILREQTNLSLNREQTDRSVVREQTDRSVVREQTDRSLVREETERSLVREQTKRSLDWEQTDNSLAREQTNRSLLQEQTDRSLVREQTDSFLVREQTDRSLVREQTDRSLLREQTDRSLIREQTDRSLIREQADRSLVRNDSLNKDQYSFQTEKKGLGSYRHENKNTNREVDERFMREELCEQEISEPRRPHEIPMDLDEIWRDDSHAVPKDRRPPELSVGRKDGNARHARLPAVLPITTTRKRPLPTKGTFKSLSKYVTKVLSDDPDASVGRRGLLIDHIIKKEQMDVFGQLDSMIKGKKAKSEEGTPFKHFSPLSLDTELESTFADSAMVKRVYLQELKEWMSKKPLDICMMGRLPIVDDQPGPIRPSLKTDKTLKKCMEEFRAGMYDLLHDGEDKFDPDNVFPCPQSSTEETTDQVFRQVTKYMNFLASKSFLVEDDPTSRGSQRPERTDTRSERLPQAITQNRNLTDKISQENISLTEDHSRRVHPSAHLIEGRFRQDVDETLVHHSNFYKERGQHETPVDSKNTSDYASASEYQRQDQSKSRHVLDDCTNAVKATSTSDRGKKILLDPVPPEKHQSDNRTDQLKRGSRTTRNHSSENILEQETCSIQMKEPVATVPQGTRPWASRPGFKDRMDAILVDREVAKPIPLEPEDQNQSSKQLHHKNSTKISPDSPEAISKLSGQAVPSKKTTEKLTQIHEQQTRKLPKEKNKDYGKDDENKSKKKKISHTETLEIKKSTKEPEVLDKGNDDQDTTGTFAPVMYSPTQPTGPDDFLFDLVEHDMKEEKDQIGRKRKVKDTESVLSKKKKKDKDKNKEEEMKRDDKKKKDKKEKKKDKDKKDKRKRSEKSKGESDQSEDEGKPKQRNLRRDHYAAPVLSLEEEILEDGEILDDESVHSAKFQGQKSFKSINLHVTEKDQSDITSLPNKAELGTTSQDGPELEATSQDPSKLSSVFIEYFMDANSHLLNKLQEVSPDVNSFHSRILEPENSFLWALVLAFHAKQREEEETVEQMLQVREPNPDASKPVPQSRSSAATAETAPKVEIIDVGSNDTPINEYGSVVAIETKSDQVQQDMPEDRESGELTPDGSDNRFDDKASGSKKRGSSRLLQAFRQQVEAKKKATLVSEEHKQKTIIKLSADQAAKKPAPKSAKPLFIPPTFIKQLDGNQTASASSKEAGQGQNPGGLSIILPNNEMIDTSVKTAFDIFAERIKDLLKEKFKKDVLDELAKDAQTLLSKSASEMKHLNSLSAIAFSIYRQHKQGVKSVNDAVKETSLNKSVEQDQSKPSKDNTNRKSSVEKDFTQRSEKSPAKGRKGNADAWKIREKLDEIDLEESQATHIEDRSKITKDIMDGHEKLDFEKDKSHKDISRLRKIGRPSYLFSARIERLVAEQKEKDEQKKMLELEQQKSVTEIELPHVEPVTIINDTVFSVAIDTVNDVTDSSVAVIVPVPEDVIEILEEEPEEIVEETKETYLVEEVPSYPVGESTTEADEEESKPKKVSMTLPKGNKLMMAFRQAMLAKKKAQQKEGFKSTTAPNKVGIQVTHQFGVKLKTSDLGQSNTGVSTVPGSAITTTVAPIVITSLTMSSSASTGSTPFSRASTMVTNSLPSQVITTSTVSCTNVPVPAPQIELPKVLPSQTGISHSAVPFQIDLTSASASESQPSITSTSTVPVQKSANLQVQPTPEIDTISIPPSVSSIPKKKPALLPTPPEYPVPVDTSIPPPGYGPPSVPPPGYGPPSGPPPGYAPSVPPPGYNQDLASGYNLPPVTGPPPGYNMPPASGQTQTGYPSSQDNTGYSSTSGSNQYNQSFHSFVPDFSKPPPLLPTPVSHQPGPPGIHTPDFHHSAPPGSHSGSSGSTQTGSYQTVTTHSDSQEAVPQSPHHPIPPQTESRQKSPDKHTKTDDLSAIPLPPSTSGNTESVTKLDQSMYDDPEMIEQYQRKVQEFLKQKKTGTAVSSNSYDGSQSSYTDWNRYYSDYSADQNNKPLSFDQWQQQWFTYWDSVSNQYTQWGDQSQGQGHWGGGGPPWGEAPPPSSSSDYNQQWNDWQRWNQTPDYSKPPPSLPPVPGTETNPPASSQSSGSSQPAKPQRGSQSPQQADDQQDSVNKDMEIETDTEAEVVDEEDSQSKHLHIYVFNHDRECCQQVKEYLVSIGASIFDCNNVDMYRFPVSPSETYLVFIHTDDLKHLHRIPNLYRMKQTPRIQFLTFSSLEQVQDKKCKPILAHGGILLPDDAALMGLTPHSLELFLDFLLTETRQDRSWCLLIHKHLFSEIDKMRLHYNENSVDYQRLVDLAQLLVRYEDYGVVETLINHECNVETRPPEEYLQCCLEQQAKCCGRARHCFLISAMTPTHPSMDIFRNFGVGVMTLSNFLQVVANKPPAAVLPMPVRKYGLRESSVFRDCSLSNCVKTIRVNIPSHIPAVPKRPLISCPVPPPGEQKTPLLPSPDEYCSTVVMGTGPDMDIQEVDMEIS